MKAKELEKDWMGSMKVSGAVTKMAIPSVISSLVTVLYNMADTFFVGQTGDALQVAAVSLTNPIFILFMLLPICSAWAAAPPHPWPLGRKMRGGCGRCLPLSLTPHSSWAYFSQ